MGLPVMLALVSEGGDGLNVLDPHHIGATFWTWVIFLIALPFMWKFVFGPISKALYERDLRAEEAIQRAEEAKTGALAAQKEVEVQLQEARREAQAQVREAKERAEKQYDELMAKAREESARERQRAAAEIEAEKQKALGELRDHVVDLTLGATKKLLAREVSGEDQKRLVQDFVKESAGSSSTGS
jgi:F-type H+-transporting ATPase subunit b